MHLDKFSPDVCKKGIPSGESMYVSNDGEDYFMVIMLAYTRLRKTEWFAEFCSN